MESTRHAFSIGLRCVVVLSLASFAVAQRNDNEQQSHMQSALQHLRQAEGELRAATQDKGGHRVQALQLVHQATQEVQAGIQYDDVHTTPGERGDGGRVRITSGPVIESLDDHSAVVAWGTNAQGSSRVEYGADRNDLQHLAEAPWGADGLTHRVRIDNLRPNTTYYFDIETAQARGSGGEVEGKRIYSFRTLPSGSSPVRDQQPR
jgi:purple acid phosphatase-like protein